MEILDKFITDKTTLAKLEDLLEKAAEELANLNDFPIEIPRIFDPSKISSSALGKLLNKIYYLIQTSTKSISLEDFVSELKLISPQVLFYADIPTNGITKESLILQILVIEISNFLPKTSSYLETSSSQNSVFKTLYTLIP